jgi:hypothetical protein
MLKEAYERDAVGWKVERKLKTWPESAEPTPSWQVQQPTTQQAAALAAAV